MATEQQIHAWLAGYPRAWDQLCQALMWQLASKFGTTRTTQPSAIAAYNVEANAGRIHGGDAPPGAFVYWAIGQYGHVGFMMNGGRVLMATTKLAEQWVNSAAGWNTVANYTSRTGARYLGWSYQNGGNTVPFTAGTPDGTPGAQINYMWKMTAASAGAIQKLLNHQKIYGGTDGGTGPVDNVLGERGIKGMQELMKRWGKLPGDYKVDGIPHNVDQAAPSNYGKALQQWVTDDKMYSGPIDGLPGTATNEAIVKNVDRIIAGTPTPTPPEPEPTPVGVPFPPAPAGFFFFPDLSTSQSTFDFHEYNVAGGRAVALKMGGGNASDSPYIAPAYRDQLTRARAEQQRVMHYWFNGRKNGVTPDQSADFFALHAGFKPGDVAAIDVENETATNTLAWTPAEAVAYAKRLRIHFPGIKGIAYMSDSVADAQEWDELKEMGWELWNASWGANGGDPGNPPETDDWPFHLAWQYTSKEKVPGNYVVENGTKVYKDTDGNLGRDDLWARLAYVEEGTEPIPPEPEPEPEPEPLPPSELNAILAQYFESQVTVNTEALEAVKNPK